MARMGRLGRQQFEFAKCLMQLLMFALSKGYRYTLGDGRCRTGHKENSFHYKGLAQDINLFDSRGNYLTKTEDHKELGIFWESLHPKCTWGGRFGDGNHYSWGES